MEESDSSSQFASQCNSSKQSDSEDNLSQVSTQSDKLTLNGSETASGYKEQTNFETQNIKCSVCTSSIFPEDINELQVYAHPVLRTLVCKTCYSRIQNVNPSKKNLCSWCYLKKDAFVKCIDCQSIFCIKCLKTNQSSDMFQYILKRKQWKCFVCVPAPLNKLRKVCEQILNGTTNDNIELGSENETGDVISTISEIQLLCCQLTKIANDFSIEIKNQEPTVENATKGYNYVLQLCDSISRNVLMWRTKCHEKLSGLQIELEMDPEDTKEVRRKIRNRSKLSLKSSKSSDSDTNEEEDNHFTDYVINNKPGCTSRSQEIDIDESQSTVNFQKSVETNTDKVDEINPVKNTSEIEKTANDDEKSGDGFNTDCSTKSGDSLFSRPTIDELNEKQEIEDVDLENFQLSQSLSEDENDKSESKDVYTDIKEVDQCLRCLSEDDDDAISESKDVYTDIKEVDQCLRCLSEDDDDSISENSSSNLDLSDSNLSDSSSSDTEHPITNVSYHVSKKLPSLPRSSSESEIGNRSEPEFNEDILNTIKPCSVVINDLKSDISHYLNSYGPIVLSQTENNIEDEEWREINRLTNLDSLTNKRKSNSKSNNKHKKTKKKASKIIDTDSSSLADSNSNSDNDENVLPVGSPLASDVEIKWNEVYSDGGVIDSDSETDYLSDDSDKNKSKLQKKRKRTNSDQDQVVVKKEEIISRKKSKWRNDAALRANLNDSDSSTDSSGSTNSSREKKKLKKLRKLDDPSTSKLSEDEDDLNSKLKSDINIAGNRKSCSDSDSSIEFVKTYKSSKKVQIIKSDSSDDSTDIDRELTPKGRKNIRAIASDRSLKTTTKIANILEINRKERIAKKNKRLESYLKSCDTTDELVLDVDETTKKPTITVHPILTQRLKPHQRRGVQFMFDCCYESSNQMEKCELGTGCILAHSMGLGKTFQVVTLIHTLFTHSITNTKYVLVVCPLSIVLNWENEFKKGLRNVKNTINIYCISERCDWQQKRQKVKAWEKRTGVLIMGYEAFHTLTIPKQPKTPSYVRFVRKMLIDPGPDLVILDEGHLLKNGKTVRTKALMEIATQRRIILTGTPMQNNLTEYYYMINFVKPNLLGSYKEFTNRFENPINNGQYHDSTEADIKQMKKRSHVLHALLNESVFQRYEASELQNYLPKKYDYVLLIQLHPLQALLYRQYLDKAAKGLPQTKLRNVFCHFTNLQLICLHPYLLHLKEQCIKQKKDWSDSISLVPNNDSIDQFNSWWHPICPDDFKTNIDYGPKYKIVLSIIRESEAVGDKVVIFSSSLVDLDAIESFLHQNATETSQWNVNEDYYRMDGSIPPEKRLIMCHNFNNVDNKRARVFLLSHRVGGLGINLIGANRLILMNVSWNPAWDNQSVFRLYRFGQVKRCYIYRLVCMGTIEEIIYGRQINKLAVSGRVIDKRQTQRHYKSEELQSMFKFDYQLDKPKLILRTPSDDVLTTLLHLHNEIYNFHEHQSLLENKPDEHLNNEEQCLAWEEFNKENEEQENRLKEAQRLKEANPLGSVSNPNNIPILGRYPNEVVNTNAFSDEAINSLRSSLLEKILPTGVKEDLIHGRQINKRAMPGRVIDIAPNRTQPFECVYLANNNKMPLNEENANQLLNNSTQVNNNGPSKNPIAPTNAGNIFINPAAIENGGGTRYLYPHQQRPNRPTNSSLQPNVSTPNNNNSSRINYQNFTRNLQQMQRPVLNSSLQQRYPALHNVMSNSTQQNNFPVTNNSVQENNFPVMNNLNFPNKSVQQNNFPVMNNVTNNSFPKVRSNVLPYDKVATNQQGRGIESTSNDCDVVIIDDNSAKPNQQDMLLTDLSKNTEITLSALTKSTTELSLSESSANAVIELD